MREAHFEVNVLKALHVQTTFGRSDVVSRGRRKRLCTLSQVSTTWGFCGISKNDDKRGTFEEDLQRCMFRGKRSTRGMFLIMFRILTQTWCIESSKSHTFKLPFFSLVTSLVFRFWHLETNIEICWTKRNLGWSYLPKHQHSMCVSSLAVSLPSLLPEPEEPVNLSRHPAYPTIQRT